MAVVSDYTALLNQYGARWNAFTAPGQPIVVTYSFMAALPAYNTDVIGQINGFTPIPESNRATIRDVVQTFDAASGIDFVEITDSDEVQIRFGAYDFTGTQYNDAAGHGGYPSFTQGSTGGDIFFNTAQVGRSGIARGWEIELAAHELGHALGLEHPFEGTDTLTPSLDNSDHTVMSYTDGSSYKSGPQYLDIQALDYYYGTAGAMESAVSAAYTPSANRIIITLSHVTGDGQTVSGTQSSDLIIGSAGNDTIAGMAGDDIIFGGAGADQVIYYGPSYNYTITHDNGLYTVAPIGTGSTADVDGRDFLVGVEQISFLNYNDGTSDIRSLADTAEDQSQDNVVYRLFNHLTGGHFFTASADERNQIISGLSHFTYEGAAFGASSTPSAAAGELEIYRFLNTANNAHFYTASQMERDSLINAAGTFQYEGIAYYGYEAGTANTQELYRFFNTETGIHFYTASAAERDSTIANLPQFQYEGLAYNVDFI